MAIILDGTANTVTPLNGALGGTTPSTVAATTITGTDLTTTGNTILGNASTDTLNVGNGGIVKDASNLVGIGNSSMSSFGAAYQTLVVGTGAGNQGMTIFAGPTSYAAYLAYKSAANSTTQGLTYYDFSNNRYYCTSVSAGVYLASGGTSWTSASDERVKDIIEPITDGLNKVNSLRSVIGKYKTDDEGTRRSFLIAQDVQAVLPEAVDATNPDELGVNYTEVIPLLVAAIKELKAEIDLLKGSA